VCLPHLLLLLLLLLLTLPSSSAAPLQLLPCSLPACRLLNPQVCRRPAQSLLL
jgi:hypothetical protein